MKRPSKTTYFCVMLLFMSSMVYGNEMHEAACIGDLPRLKQLPIEAEDINSLDKEPGSKYEYPHGTPLHWAVRSGQVGIVIFLIKNEADINAKTDAGVSLVVETPLDYAVWGRNIALVRILLEAGANVEGSGHEFHWPFMKAIVNEDFEMAHLLLDYGADIHRTGMKR